jgi:hypothetical protein
MASHDTLYCFDTSAFIDAWRRFYSPDYVFCKPVWERVENLMANSQVIIHEEVLTELKEKDDEIYRFVKRFPSIVKKTTEEQIELASTILGTHSQMIDKAKTQKNHADVWVITLAKIEGATVVTFEGADGGFKIPAVCKAYKVACLSFQSFLKEEGV